MPIYRRDEIDATHFPVFHQDAVRRIYRDKLSSERPEAGKQNNRYFVVSTAYYFHFS